MAYAETQKISGAATIDFGQMVAMQGYYAITSDNSANGYFYRRQIDGELGQISTFTMPTATASFGDALDIGNLYFIAGDSAHTSDTGRAGVFAIDAPSTLIQTFTGAATDDTFGDAVAISDDYILIGAQGADSNAGDACLYIKGTGATWTAYSGNPITPTLRAAEDFFGCAVAISGDTLIIGAEGDNNKTGAIYIFEKNDVTNLWEESQKLLVSDGYYNDQFGEAIAASGDYFVAGASLSESVVGEVNSGAAYIYKYGTSWYEVDKLVGTDESSYSGNHFGESVDINGDYIIIGSPVARGTGVADIFYKKRSWGHLVKVTGSDSAVDDLFGTSVAISGRHVLVGAPSESTNGAIYFSEDPPVRLRLAQEFDVNGLYLPSKASVYLKRIGKNSSDYWPVYNTVGTVIDSTNFSTIDSGENIVTFEDSLSDFTGNGYMYLNSDTSTTFSTINYPVRAIVSGTFNLWIRCITSETATFQADILIDGVQSKTINETITNPSDSMWDWVNVTLVLPDIREHVLGIRIKENGAAIDKIYIDASSNTPYSEGPDYGESPYLTVHMKVYDSSLGSPDNSLFIYDYKNSIDSVVQSDWYNFNINVLDNGHGFTEASNFAHSYFLVMSCSGTTHDNFVVWEMVDNDEYVMSPSAFMF